MKLSPRKTAKLHPAATAAQRSMTSAKTQQYRAGQ